MADNNQRKWALVTGASSGIGEAFAKRFAREGWNLILVARSIDKLHLLSSMLRDIYPVKTMTIQADLRKADACKKIYEELRVERIEVGALVNNAGFGAVGSFVWIDRIRQLEMVDLNVKALLELTHLFLPAMIERKDGIVINVSSTASFQAIPYFATYSATKAFVTAFSEALWAECRQSGVRVMNLCPGSTKTNFGRVAGKNEDISDWRPVQTADEVVDGAFRALANNKPTIVTNVFDNTLRFFERLLPRKWIVLITQKVAKRMGYHE